MQQEIERIKVDAASRGASRSMDGKKNLLDLQDRSEAAGDVEMLRDLILSAVARLRARSTRKSTAGSAVNGHWDSSAALIRPAGNLSLRYSRAQYRPFLTASSVHPPYDCRAELTIIY